MARRRMVDPDFFTDSKLIRALTIPERLMYVGLWTLAEDSGCLSGDPATIKLKLFPGDLVAIDAEDAELLRAKKIEPELVISEALEKLTETKRLIAYEVDGEPYFFIRHFHRHQRLDNPTPPKLPLPPFVRWYGEELFAEGEPGKAGYKKNRHLWKYDVSGEPLPEVRLPEV